MANSQVSDPATHAGDGSTPFHPPSEDRPYGWPTWVRRSIIGAALALCAALMVISYDAADHGENVKDPDPIIVAQFPAPGAKEPRQTSVVVDLKLGYDGRLTINGIAIPESEMDGARDPKSVSAEDLEANGLRPNNRNHVGFTPGPGKVIEKFDSGTLRISVQYFKDRQSQSTGRTVSWTATVV